MRRRPAATDQQTRKVVGVDERKKAEREALDERYAALCGPVTVTKKSSP